MPVVDTSLMSKERPPIGDEAQQIYCGLDCCVTTEVHEVINETYAGQGLATYAFERALQAPYLDIMRRGFAVDEVGRRFAAAELRRRASKLQSILDALAEPIWGKGLNPASPKQLQDFFYGKMRLPEQFISQKGVKRVSTNREALEKLDVYFHAQPFVACILALRDISKQLDVFEIALNPSTGRFHTSYNIAGTETGRASSSESSFGDGGNAQNIAAGLRYVFIADHGWKICVIDLEQVEARDVGFICGILFGDWRFLDNCESGDLHTNNAKLIWPNLAWTGDPAGDKALAEKPFYREYSFRDMAKRGGHLSNYSGTAFTAARSLKVPLPIMVDFQARYVRGSTGNNPITPAFPSIPQYWQWAANQIQTAGFIETPFARRRHFFGRSSDDSTVREAIAFTPQSMTADRTNLGLYKVWSAMPHVQMLAQTHDSITFQYPDRGHRYECEVIAQALDLIRVELKAPNGRSFVVPGEAKIGWNWGYRSEKAGIVKNPDGMIKFKESKADTRLRQKVVFSGGK